MALDKVFDVAGAIVGVALVSVIVASPNTAKVISAVGSLFAGSIRAAKA